MQLSKQTLAKFAGVFSGLAFGIYWIPLRALEQAGFPGLWATLVFNATPLSIIAPLLLWHWRVFVRGSARFHICGALIPGAIATVFSPSHLNPGVAGLLFMTEISVGASSAALFAGEPFGASAVAGVALITLAGVSEPLHAFASRRAAAPG